MPKPFDEVYRSAVDQITASDALKENTIHRALRASAAPTRARRVRQAAIACAACACLVLTAALSIPRTRSDNFAAMDAGGAALDGTPENYQITAGGAQPKSEEDAMEKGEQDPLASPQTFGYQPDPIWNEGELHFNDGAASIPSFKFSGQGLEPLPMTQEEFFDYLGRDPRPASLPEDLTVHTPDDSESVTLYRDAEGNAVNECVTYTFEAPLPDGVDYEPTQRRLTLNVAKGILPARDYLFLAEGTADSNIGGTPLTVTRSVMTYGPYDPETHEPAGSYELYSAEFLYNGVGYFLYSDNLTQQEFVDILCSILLSE